MIEDFCFYCGRVKVRQGSSYVCPEPHYFRKKRKSNSREDLSEAEYQAQLEEGEET